MRRFILLVFLVTPLVAFGDASSAHFKVIGPTITPGGIGSSTSYSLKGTVGELAHGTSTSQSFTSKLLGFFSFSYTTKPVLSAATNVSQTVALSWSAAVPYLGVSVSGYDIGSSTIAGGPYTYQSVGNVLTYTAQNLTNGTAYYYIVRALDQTGIPVATSSEISATPTAPSLTFITDGASQSFPSLTPGVLVATSSILTVKTTNSSGFLVTVARSNSSATLTLNGNTGVVIADKTAWSAPGATTTSGGATASTTQPQTLQFRLLRALTDIPNYASAWWGADDTAANALFAGFPSSAQSIANRSTAAAATTTLRVLYNVSVPSTQNTGTYSGDLVYSVSANP